MIIKLAKHNITGKIIHIDEAQRGLPCNCLCVECGQILEACKGDIREKHFRHYVKSNCTGSQETALHKLAKQIITEHNEIGVSEKLFLNYDNVQLEQFLGTYKSDATIWVNDEPVHLEFRVHHAVEVDKERFYKSSEKKSLEIDLRSLIGSDYEYSQVKKLVLHSTHNKRIIFWEKQSLARATPSNEGAFVFLILFIFGLIWLSND